MSQTTVTSFYATRRSNRIQNNKANSVESVKNVLNIQDTITKSVSLEVKAKNECKLQNKGKASSKSKSSVSEDKSKKPKTRGGQILSNAISKQGAKSSKKIPDASQSKVTSFYESLKVSKEPNSNTDDGASQSSVSVSETPLKEIKKAITNKVSDLNPGCQFSTCRNSDVNAGCFGCFKTTTNNHNEITSAVNASENKTEKSLEKEILQSPKRYMIHPSEVNSPEKKLLFLTDEAALQARSPSKYLTPRKLFDTEATLQKALSPSKSFTPRKLFGDTQSVNDVNNEHKVFRSPKRQLIHPGEGTSPKKKLLLSDETAPLKAQTPSKCLTPKKLFDGSQTVNELNDKKLDNKSHSEETKKAIAEVKRKLTLVRNYQANAFKVTSVISSSSSQKSEKKSVSQTIPAYEKFSYLTDPEFTEQLTLPFKYKLLLEMFRSMDTVISILYNRKEKVTFEKVKEGVQKMMKRTFSEVHVGQIITVLPTAYDVTLEKNTFKKTNDPDYQIIINPKLKAIGGSKKSNQKIVLTPVDLSERKLDFNNQLLNLVKQHHEAFLSRLNFPAVPTETIKRWHPKFALDQVPDIKATPLPEIPETKVYSAKDVLNRVVKGSLRGKVVKALKSVAEESSRDKIEQASNLSSQKTPQKCNKDLKGVCADLIAKVRARESAKFLECMIESPDAAKQRAMKERLPKIINILWHYFIAERKAAVPVDTAVEKIIHSCQSLSTHEDVKAHLALITETFPGWLSFIRIPKGTYITINKNKNIKEMLDNFQC